MKDFSKNKFATTIVIVATLLLAGVAVFSAIRLYNLRSESVTPNTPESEPSADCGEESCWEECNGWDTNPNYDETACRRKALNRADNGIADKDRMSGDFYDHGLPLPPSGDKDSPNGGTDQQWYNWGMTDTSPVDFLSHGTSCGLGPNACTTNEPSNTPTLTPTSTVTPTQNPSNTPTLTPTNTPTDDPTRRPTKTPTPTLSPTVTPTGIPPQACTPLSFSLAAPNLACLGDQVIYDKDRDGIQDTGETGVSDITVKLYDDDDSLLKEIKTDKDGKYQFCNLEPGSYYVAFNIDDKYTISDMEQGSDRCKDSDADTDDGVTDDIDLKAGDNYLCLDALIYEEDGPTNTPTPTVTSTPRQSVTATPTTGTRTSSPTPTTGTAEGDSADLPEAGYGLPTLILVSVGVVLSILAFAVLI